MADVFLAEDEQLGRKVALKLLHRRFSEDPGFVERFRREAQAAAGLQHPNIVGVYDRGSYDGTYYIAMEYLPGPLAQAADPPGGACRSFARDRDHDPGAEGGALCPPPRGDPPRPQAPQRDHRRHRSRQGHGLRDCPGRCVGYDRDRLDHGHGPVPLARTGPGPRGQRRARISTRSASSSTSCSPAGSHSTPRPPSRSRSSTSRRRRRRQLQSTRRSRRSWTPS